MKPAFAPHQISKENFQPIRDWVIATDMNFEGRTLSSGVILLGDNGRSDGRSGRTRCFSWFGFLGVDGFGCRGLGIGRRWKRGGELRQFTPNHSVGHHCCLRKLRWNKHSTHRAKLRRCRRHIVVGQWCGGSRSFGGHECRGRY